MTIKPKIYLAARYSRIEEMQDYRAQLQSLGYAVTSRWVDGNHRMSPGPGADAASQLFAIEDRTDVLAAELVIVFAEKQRTPTRGGRMVEMGIALGAGIPVICVGEHENVFFHLPEVVVVRDFSTVLSVLAEDSCPN